MPDLLRSRLRTGALLVSAAIVGLTAAAVQTATAADFSGKRMQIIVPFSEGGGTDSWTRMMAPYLEQRLPGKPKVLILNKPGAGGINGANYYHERAPKDGSMIFALSISTILWAALHANYTAFGIAEVFLIGLLFCWLLWRTGSLRGAIFCHALYNSLIVIVLRFVQLPA